MSAAAATERGVLLTPAKVARYYRIRLPRLRQTDADEWRGPCPIHGGQRDSFAVERQTGRWYCHSECARGGSVYDLEMALSDCDFATAAAEVRGIVGGPESNGAGRKITATYDYRDERGELLFQVVRFSPKSFAQRVPDGSRWTWRLGGVRRVLYKLPRVLKEPVVYVCEGEKDADALEGLGVVATTAPGGAGKWRQEYTESLRGKAVVILPDNDGPGREHAQQVARELHGVADTVRVVELPGLRQKGDVSDWIAAGGTRDELLRLKRETPTWEPQAPEGIDDQAELERLAALGPFEYDRERCSAAERLGVRVSTLDAERCRFRGESEPNTNGQGRAWSPPEIEPWPEPVDGTALLDELADTVRQYVVLPSVAADAVALWVVHAHAIDTASISPRLAIVSPLPECGKTTLLTLLSGLVPRPLPAANLTPAVTFRAIERGKPSLLIDEADTFLRDNDELRGVLNSGHARGSAYVLRSVGEDHEPRRFGTWAAVAIACIGKLPPTLTSRSIIVSLKRMRREELVARLRGDRLDHFKPLARRTVRWVQDHARRISDDPALPEALTGRRGDNWRHLIAIADAAGGQWRQRARRVAESFAAATSSEAFGEMLLDDVAAVFAERGADRLPSEDIVNGLLAMDDRPWPELSRGRPISKPKLARMLGSFGVHSRTIRMPDGRTPKGYLRSDLDEPLSRYSPDQTATTPQSNRHGDSGHFQSATGENGVAFSKCTKANRDGACGGVALCEPESPDEDVPAPGDEDAPPDPPSVEEV